MKRFSNKYFPVLIILLLLAVALAIPGKPDGSTSSSIVHAQGSSSISYLPLIASGPLPKKTFGMTIDTPFWDSFNPSITQGTTWTRIVLPWSAVEAVENTFNWSAVAWVENRIKTATQNGLEVILIVDNTPTWALKLGYSCGVVAQNKFPALQTFLTKAVERYYQAPYSVKYWELWNEPDVSNWLGCWGQPGDPYYGGGYYGEMLKAAYPAIKSAYNGANVLVGGLLLDCDPNNPPSGKDCTPAKFLEGILRNGGKPYFDGVSFHAYDYYRSSLGAYFNPNWNSTSNVDGPVLIKKTRYLRSLLSQFGAGDKLVMNTEVAVICGTGTEPHCIANEFEMTKSYYIPQAYAAGIAEDLDANLWYSLMGWRGSALIDGNFAPRPALTAFQTAMDVLEQSHFSKKIENYPGLNGYELIKNGMPVWVIWSIDGFVHNITLPSTPTYILDTFGNTIPVNGLEMQIGLQPIYVGWN